MNAWKFEIAPGEDTERALAVRNPYYWKIDTEGTQLPYFDRVVYQMVADPQVLLLKTMQGEIDMMDQYIATRRTSRCSSTTRSRATTTSIRSRRPRRTSWSSSSTSTTSTR